MPDVKMTVNGKSVSGSVECRTLLVDFIRNDLQLTGTHVGCDTSQCGACAIHVDGKLVKACTMFALEANESVVSTIEGQANNDGSLNFIQQAFKVMAATDLLKTNSKPSELEIREHLEGNICRCTGYHNIVKAILAASGQDTSSIAAE